MANMAVSRIKREFKEVIKSEEVSGWCYVCCAVYLIPYYSRQRIAFLEHHAIKVRQPYGTEIMRVPFLFQMIAFLILNNFLKCYRTYLQFLLTIVPLNALRNVRICLDRDVILSKSPGRMISSACFVRGITKKRSTIYNPLCT